MTRAGFRRLVAGVIVLALLMITIHWISRWWSNRGPMQQISATPEQLERGRYLADAADCAACHTVAGGAPFSGGFPLPSPFGTLYGTNITPDPDHGIGRYTATDFFHALTAGEARDGHQLYPAMPYVSYKTITRQDSDAIYAYLMNLPAVAQPNRENELSFPANIRMGLNGWNLLFAKAELPPASMGSSVVWQRGRYLVETLGHCGECHTSRGALGQLQLDRSMTGNADLGRFAAPDITPQGLASRGWDATMLRDYLATGVSPLAVASDEMLMVVNLSTSRLDDSDLNAITTYLLGDQPPAPIAQAITTGVADSPGQRHYLDLCAGCHGRDGEGVPNVAVRLRGNTSLRDTNPHNLVVAILDGLPVHDFPGMARMQDMPGFAADLSDADVAALANWLRHSYGGQTDTVEVSVVRKLRDGQSAH